MKLISMLEFVSQFAKPVGYFEDQNDFFHCQVEYMGKVLEYANFLKQPLTLGMFVPCDFDGNVIKLSEEHKKEPNNWSPCEIEWYKKSKERVLFKGFELEYQSRYTIIVFNEVLNKQVKFDLSSESKLTIESISNYNAELTESAIKQLGL